MPLAIIVPLWDVGCMTGFMMQHFEHEDSIPIGSMYGITYLPTFTIQNQPNVV